LRSLEEHIVVVEELQLFHGVSQAVQCEDGIVIAGLLDKKRFRDFFLSKTFVR